MERYLSFTIDNLCFVDSLQFTNESLEKLCKNLHREDCVLIVRHSLPDKYEMLIRKEYFAMTIGTVLKKLTKRIYLHAKRFTVA